MTRKVLVRCTLEVEIEVPMDDDDDMVKFRIEENGCPGTGDVGAAIDAVYERGTELSVCWACNLKGKNEIISANPPFEKL